MASLQRMTLFGYSVNPNYPCFALLLSPMPPQTVCNNFIKGQCSYGNNCRFLHQRPIEQTVVRASNPFATSNQALTVEASVEAFKKDYLNHGVYALTSYAGMTGDISPEEFRWYGNQMADAIATRERMLGVSLDAYKARAEGSIAASRVYPAFVPRSTFTVISDELLSELKW